MKCILKYMIWLLLDEREICQIFYFIRISPTFQIQAEIVFTFEWFCILILVIILHFKRTVCTDGNVRFTIAPLKPYSDQQCGKYRHFSDWKSFYLYINLAWLSWCLFVCLFVSNKRQNGWTDRVQICIYSIYSYTIIMVQFKIN